MQTSPAPGQRLTATIHRTLRTGQSVSFAALVLLFGCNALQNAAANGDTRTLSFHHLHTNEDLTITYKRDGRYDEDALKKINWTLRDWRRNEPTRMDPQVLDAVWELYRDVGGTQPIEIICGYRAPGTNAMLRQRSSGVARFSQHTLGKAIDLHIPGVSLEAQRAAALRLHRGGVGYYPSSTFIHVDVGNIRHWPRMSYDQLARVFPDGRTVHVASNGRPLPGYQLALADISKRGRSPSKMSLDAAQTAGVDVTPAASQRPTFLASASDGAKDPEEDEDASPATKAAPKAAAAPGATKVAAADVKSAQKSESRKSEASRKNGGNAPSKTALAEAAAPSPRRAPSTAIAPSKMTDNETPWPLSAKAQRDRVPIDVALAYAASDPVQQTGPSSQMRPAATVSLNDQTRSETLPGEQTGDDGAVTVVKKTNRRLSAGAKGQAPQANDLAPAATGMSFDDPWLRAAMFAPSLHTSLTMSSYAALDQSELGHLMHKPMASVVMTFSGDPLNGLTCEQFRGNAIVFVSTVTFKRTASLSLRESAKN